MFYYFATVALAPIFILQGRYVRKVTPKLPEAAGNREHLIDTNAKRLLILGDSAAAGVGVKHQKQALSGRLASQLSATEQLNWQLLATSGHTSQDLINQIKTMPTTHFDIAVISIGVNDVTKRTSTKRWQANIETIISLLTNKFCVKKIVLSAVPPMHLFPALPQPLRWWLGKGARMLNEIIENTAKQHHHVHYLAMSFPFKKEYMASDGFHPGAQAYTLWAQAIVELLESSELT